MKRSEFISKKILSLVILITLMFFFAHAWGGVFKCGLNFFEFTELVRERMSSWC